MCRRGRENLRKMTKKKFGVKVDNDDPDQRSYIFQAIDECDKNHKEKEITSSNDGRIYEIPGKLINF